MGAGLFIGCVAAIVLIGGINYLVEGEAGGMENMGVGMFGYLDYDEYVNMSNQSRINHIENIHGGRPTKRSRDVFNDADWNPITFFMLDEYMMEFPDGFVIAESNYESFIYGEINREDYNFVNNPNNSGGGWVSMLEGLWKFMSLDFKILSDLGAMGWIIKVPLISGIVYSLVEAIWIG